MGLVKAKQAFDQPHVILPALQACLITHYLSKKLLFLLRK